MKRVLRSVAIAGVFAAAGFGLPALAQPGPGGGPRGPHPGMHGHGPEHMHRMLMHMADKLELTEAQRDEIRTILETSHSGVLGEQMEALTEAKRQLGSVIHDLEATEQQVIDACRSVAAVEEQLALERRRTFVAINGVLTPEQQQRAKELHSERPDGPGGFGRKHRGFRHGG